MSELTIYLWRDGLRIARCKAHTLGGSHLFIATDPLPYKRGQSIVIEFPWDRPEGFEKDGCVAQVVERTPAGLTRHLDLSQAFGSPAEAETQREWRVHFHVPIFLDDLGDFSSTQFFIREMLDLHRAQPRSKHLEVETYTWGVLPERYRGEPVETAIVRELNWVKERLTP